MKLQRVLLVAVVASAAAVCAAGDPRAPSQDEPLRSPRITALAADLEAGRAGAVDAFRRELEAAGTPLVEPLPGEPSKVLVTFVWFAERELSNVVVQSWLESRSVERRAMRQLGSSGVWYATFRAPANLTMGYFLSPDDLRLLPGVEGDETDTWVRDPLNPRRARGAFGVDWSVVNLSGRLLDPWMAADAPQVPAARLIELEVASDALGANIPLKVYVPPAFSRNGTERYPLLLFFDGFGFFDIDQAHRLVEALVVEGAIRAPVVGFIYNPDATRNRDMSCYEPTHRFLAEELIPVLRERFRAGSDPTQTILAGRSRSGLGAVCAAYTLPKVIGGAIAQSGSFWWAPEAEEPEWLARDMATAELKPIALYLDAGELEDGPDPDLGLSMLTVTRHLRDVARARGYEVHYAEFPGGHDPIGWRTTLPEAIRAMLGPNNASR